MDEACNFSCWLEANSTLFQLFIWTPLVAILSTLIGLTTARFGRVSEREKLQDAKSRPGAIARYRNTQFQSYLSAIDRVLDWADRFYGPNWSAQSYARCLLIAFLYPLFSVFFGWTFFDLNTVGGFQLMEAGFAFWDRVWRLAALTFAWIVAFLILTHLSDVASWGVDMMEMWARTDRYGGRLVAKLATRVEFEFGYTSLLTLLLALATAFAFGGTLPFAGAFAFTIDAVALSFLGVLALATVFGVMFAMSGIVASFVELTFYIVITVAFTGFIAFGLTAADAFTAWVGFFILLPLVNAKADFISVNLTRWFLEHIVVAGRCGQQRSLKLVLLNLLLDLVAAALTLSALILLIVLSLDAWAWASPDTLLLDWRLHLEEIRDAPSNGTLVYLMCMTTLIPTTLHIIAGIGAMFTQKSRLMTDVADRLDALPGEPDLNDIDDALRDLRWATFWGYFSASLLTLVPLAVIVVLIF